MQRVGPQTTNAEKKNNQLHHQFMFATVYSVNAPVQTTSMHNNVLCIATYVVLNLTDTNNDHLAGHVVVLNVMVGPILQFLCLGEVVLDTVHVLLPHLIHTVPESTKHGWLNHT